MQRRQRGPDARVVRDTSLLERDVQVGAYEHPFAGDVGIACRPRHAPLRGNCRGDVGRDLRNDIDEPAAVAPLVVVPAEHLGHAPVGHRQVAVENARVRRVDDVGRDEWIVRVAKNALERAGVSRSTIGGVAVVDRHVAAEPDDQVRDRPGRYGCPDGDAVHLALQIGQHQSDCTSGPRRRRNEVDRRRACTAQVLVWEVEDLLVVGVGVNGGHESLFDRAGVVEHFGEWRNAVRGARRVRDDVVLVGVVGVVVDAEHDRHVWIGRGSRDDDLLRAGVEMLLRAVAVGEEPGRLDDEVDLELAPWQRSRVPFREHLQFRRACSDDAVPDLHVLAELPENGVELQKVPHSLGVTKIVDSHDLEIPRTLKVRAKEVPANPPESVDPHPSLSHGLSLNKAAAADAGFAGVGWKLLALRAKSSKIIMARGARRIFAETGGPGEKLPGRPPPPVEPRSGPWRRTGSESAAGRAQTRRKAKYCALLAPSTTRPTGRGWPGAVNRKSTRLNSSHSQISYAVFCLTKKNE